MIKLKVEYHKFEQDSNGNPDVHTLSLKSPKNVPLFLDEKERNYMKIHCQRLKSKHKNNIENIINGK